MNEGKTEENGFEVHESFEDLLEEKQGPNDDIGDESPVRGRKSFESVEELTAEIAKNGTCIVFHNFLMTTPTISWNWDLWLIVPTKDKRFALSNLGWGMPIDYCFQTITTMSIQHERIVMHANDFLEKYKEIKENMNYLKDKYSK